MLDQTDFTEVSFAYSSRIISKRLGELISNSLDTSVVPDEWLRAKVTTIFKPGKKLIANNYQLISYISILCKVIECIILD